MSFQAVVLFSTTLLAIVNPVGSAVMFAAVAGRFPKVPLAIPGTVGAGTIATVVIQASTYNASRDLLIISAISLIVAIIVWAAFRMAAPISTRLGPIGMNIVTRVMGILLTATAFGLLGRGIGGLLPGLLK